MLMTSNCASCSGLFCTSYLASQDWFCIGNQLTVLDSLYKEKLVDQRPAPPNIELAVGIEQECLKETRSWSFTLQRIHVDVVQAAFKRPLQCHDFLEARNITRQAWKKDLCAIPYTVAYVPLLLSGSQILQQRVAETGIIARDSRYVIGTEGNHNSPNHQSGLYILICHLEIETTCDKSISQWHLFECLSFHRKASETIASYPLTPETCKEKYRRLDCHRLEVMHCSTE